MSFQDVGEEILALFAEAQALGSPHDSALRLKDLAQLDGLRLDSYTARRAMDRWSETTRVSSGAFVVDRTYGTDRQRVYIDSPPIVNEARICDHCGGAIEIRPGCARPIHLGKYKTCARPLLERAA